MKDLFSTPELLPVNIQTIIEKYGECDTYEQCAEMQTELEANGYTFDWYLTSEPYNLRKLPLLNNVQITINDHKRTAIVNILLKQQNLNKILLLQYAGGFKRFELSIYDDSVINPDKSKHDDYKQVKAFINFHCK